MSKISGPLLDRIDLHLEVPALSSTELLSNTQSENSQIIKTRILEARGRQQKRFANAGITTNSHMNHRQIKKSCTLDTEGKKLLKAAIDELGLSARAYDKILKIARTIADLA
ncbi:MAG: ATP-binding protein, partial [Candidatus Omnitrophica bacterium]|nr:ATP-binding protein [Candidatus Omnitrophota bacterium]